MKDIALLVNSDDMISMAKDAAKHAGAEDEIEVILTHTYEESLDIARKCESEGARIMIARGGHARFLREAEDTLLRGRALGGLRGHNAGH